MITENIRTISSFLRSIIPDSTAEHEHDWEYLGWYELPDPDPRNPIRVYECGCGEQDERITQIFDNRSTKISDKLKYNSEKERWEDG